MSLRNLSQLRDVLEKVQFDGDPIMFSKQTQNIGKYCVETCRNDQDIQKLFQHINTLALDNEDLAINVAHVFTSRFMDTIKFQGSQTTVRNEVLRLLQRNFASKYA